MRGGGAFSVVIVPCRLIIMYIFCRYARQMKIVDYADAATKKRFGLRKTYVYLFCETSFYLRNNVQSAAIVASSTEIALFDWQ